MKRTMIQLIICVIVVLISACSITPESKVGSKSNFGVNSEQHSTQSGNQMKGVLTVHADTDVLKVYNSVESLVQDASIVIEGEVQSTEYFEASTIYTKSVVKVVKSIAGNVKKGDIVTFVERGGMTIKGELSKADVSGKINFKAGEENDPVEYIFDGVKTMKKGERVILFGKLDDKKSFLPQDFYWPVGTAFQGKLIVNGDYVERVIPKNEGNLEDGPSISSLKMSRSELEKKVKVVKR